MVRVFEGEWLKHQPPPCPFSIASEFSGHMRDALMYIARGAEADGQGIQRDADMLEAAMAGAGTKDERLTWRIVRGHWNRPRFEAVKQAYQRTYGKSLKKRVEGETTGKFEVSEGVGAVFVGGVTTRAHRTIFSGFVYSVCSSPSFSRIEPSFEFFVSFRNRGCRERSAGSQLKTHGKTHDKTP